MKKILLPQKIPVVCIFDRVYTMRINPIASSVKGTGHAKTIKVKDESHT